MSDKYPTPEGFELPKPLLLPDVRDFAELFEYVREWDHATMTSGPREANRELIPDPVRVGDLEVGPFLSGKIAGTQRSLAIRATPATVAALAGSEGRFSFELFEHKNNGRVLVTARESQMIRSQYLAYIDPATVPAPRS